MEYRMLEVTPVSAEDLKDVKLFGKMQTYVVAWVDPSRKASTNLDKQGGKNPNWNHKLLIPVDDRILQQPHAFLVLEIYSKGLLDSKIVGRVNVPLQEISGKNSGDVPFSYKVRRPSGKFQGILHVSVKIGEKTQAPQPSSSAEPAMAYPVGYPPQQQGMYPPQYPQQGYHQQQQGMYPPQYGNSYGYPQVAPPRRNRFGAGGPGLGMGLAGGLLGGMLIGEMLDNDHYDGGYDDYGGGGDFGGGDFGGGDF